MSWRLCLALLLAPGSVWAQDAPRAVLAAGTNEVQVGAGAAWGVEVFNSSTNHDFVVQTLSWGRVLTAPRGPGMLRGRLQWAIEVVPIFGQHEPRAVYGAGLNPIIWRWNLEPRGRLLPYFELGGGGLWTTSPVPEETTRSNFTAHLGAGVRWLTRSRREGAVFTYRFHHLSNGNRIPRNPGINSHQIHVGYSWIR